MSKALLSMKDLEAQYESDIEDATARLNKPAGNTIGTRNSVFSYKGDKIGRSFVSIIVDFVHAQTWYREKFDPDNPSPPTCHALSVTGEEMQPFEDSPEKQSDWCDGCPLDAWESADTGRGKACGQQYKVALLAAGPGETLASAELAVLTVPPTSLKNFDAYVKSLKGVKRPPHGVLTRFSFDEDAEHPVLVFANERKVDNIEDAQAINARRKEARELLMTPPDFTQAAAPTKKKTANKKKRKKVAKKASKKKTAKKTTAKKKRGASKFS
jgi:hypothetical protein